MSAVVIDRLLRDDAGGLLPERSARVQVAIELGKRARRDLHAQAVAGIEPLTRAPQIELVLLDDARGQRFLALVAMTEAGADDPVVQPLGESARPHVEELDRPVRIARRRRGVDRLPEQSAHDYRLDE